MKLVAKILMIGLALSLSGAVFAGKYNSIISIGDPMPAFDNLPSTSGKNISSDDLNEDVLVFVSLANHCPWVRGMDKDLVELANSFDGKSVRVIGLSMNHREDDRLPAMKIHADKYGYRFDYLFDESQELGRMLGATRTPEYFVFNKERKLMYTGALYDSPAKMDDEGMVKHINGEPSQFFVKDAVTALLDGKEVAIKETRAHGCTVKYVQ
ncbi:MAG: redoxin domain-containing protein [Gammaproteobacteria bacterium]